jgi:hypothetical protein
MGEPQANTKSGFAGEQGERKCFVPEENKQNKASAENNHRIRPRTTLRMVALTRGNDAASE